MGLGWVSFEAGVSVLLKLFVRTFGDSAVKHAGKNHTQLEGDSLEIRVRVFPLSDLRWLIGFLRLRFLQGLRILKDQLDLVSLVNHLVTLIDCQTIHVKCKEFVETLIPVSDYVVKYFPEEVRCKARREQWCSAVDIIDKY